MGSQGPTGGALTSPAKIKEPVFIGIAWAGVAISIVFFTARIGVRIKAFNKLFADDALVFFACLLLLINSIIWQVSKDDLYLNIGISSGQIFPPPVDFPERTTRYLRRTIVVIVFFYTGLWAIKLSFLLFFRRLGHNVRNQKPVWWTVLAITVATYFACLGTIEYHCLAGSFEYILGQCSQKPGPIKFQRDTLRWNMIMDVLTDALIILVPVNMLWRVQISLRQKLGLAGIFSITVIIMIFAIIRVVVVSSFSQQPDQTWLYMWSSIEQTVSIMVACLASFRALFSKSTRPAHQRIHEESKPSAGFSSRLALLFSSSRFTKSSKESKDSYAMNTAPPPVPGKTRTLVSVSKDPWSPYNDITLGSEERILPPNSVHVKHEVDLA